jgi:hypothetical protein
MLSKINDALNTKISPDIKDFFEQNKDFVSNIDGNLSFLNKESVDPEILFLGTVSMKP